VTRTPFRGNAPMGHGGTNGKYPVVISNSGSCSTNKSDYIKPSTLNTKGMLARKYKWMNGGGTNHHDDPAHNPVKPDDNYPENFSQSSYIKSKASTAAITSIVNDAGDKSCHAGGGNCGYHIGGKYYQRNMYYKNPSQPLDYEQYKLFLNRKSLKNCAHCACEDPNADPKTCKKKKLCPPGSCPTCKGHYDSTTGASIKSPEFDARLGLKCTTLKEGLITNGNASEFIDSTGNLPPEALNFLNKVLLSDSGWVYTTRPYDMDNNGMLHKTSDDDFVIILADEEKASQVGVFAIVSLDETNYTMLLTVNNQTAIMVKDDTDNQYPFYSIKDSSTKEGSVELLQLLKKNGGTVYQLN